MIELEITKNPFVLFELEVNASKLSLHNLFINDSAFDINKDLIEITFNEIYTKKVDRTFFSQNKLYVEIDGKKTEFTLKERIDAVINLGGWLGYRDGSRFEIKNKKIVSFALIDYQLAPYVGIKKKDLINKLGPDTKVEEFYHHREGDLVSTEIIDQKRQIVVTWDDSRGILSDVCFGQIAKEV